MKCPEDSRGHIGLNGFLFVEFDTSRSAIAVAVSFGSVLFARYALSSQSVRSGRTRSEIFR